MGDVLHRINASWVQSDRTILLEMKIYKLLNYFIYLVSFLTAHWSALRLLLGKEVAGSISGEFSSFKSPKKHCRRKLLHERLTGTLNPKKMHTQEMFHWIVVIKS